MQGSRRQMAGITALVPCDPNYDRQTDRRRHRHAIGRRARPGGIHYIGDLCGCGQLSCRRAPARYRPRIDRLCHRRWRAVRCSLRRDRIRAGASARDRSGHAPSRSAQRGAIGPQLGTARGGRTSTQFAGRARRCDRAPRQHRPHYIMPTTPIARSPANHARP